MNKKTKVYFHGELIIVERPAPFAGVRKLAVSEDLKLADSETTGNHHMLKIVPGVHVFQDLDDMDRFSSVQKSRLKFIAPWSLDILT